MRTSPLQNADCSISHQPPVRRSSRRVGGSILTRAVTSMRVLRSRCGQCDPDLALLVAGVAAVPGRYGPSSQTSACRCEGRHNVIKVIGRHAEETRKLFEIATWNLLTAEERTGSVTTSSCPSLE